MSTLFSVRPIQNPSLLLSHFSKRPKTDLFRITKLGHTTPPYVLLSLNGWKQNERKTGRESKYIFVSFFLLFFSAWYQYIYILFRVYIGNNLDYEQFHTLFSGSLRVDIHQTYLVSSMGRHNLTCSSLSSTNQACNKINHKRIVCLT